MSENIEHGKVKEVVKEIISQRDPSGGFGDNL